MRPIEPVFIPDLLFELGHDALLRGLPNKGAADSEHALQEQTTAYITTMYYSALANQYLQSALPDDAAEIDDRMPRLKIAVERSYADFTAAADWLAKNGKEFIGTSPAKQYYDEALGLGGGSVRDIAGFYSQKAKK